MSLVEKHETFASVVDEVKRKVDPSSDRRYISPINGNVMNEYKCGDIPVMADLESRVVFPKFDT